MYYLDSIAYLRTYEKEQMFASHRQGKTGIQDTFQSKCFSFSLPATTLEIHSTIIKQLQLNVMRLSFKPYTVVLGHFKVLRTNSDNCLH